MSALRLFDKFQKLLDVTWGSIADGQTLKRSGSNIIGYTPAGGSGDVVGPAGGVVDGEVVSYNSTTGKIIKASAAKLSADLVTGPASVTTGRVASFNGTTGKIVQQGTQLAADLVTGPASSVDSEIALFNSTTGKIVKSATGTGYVTVTNGVYQTPTSADMAGRMPRGHIWGLTLSNNGTDATNDIDISLGEARDSTNAVDIVLASAITKRLDAAWAVGTNQGGLDTGSIANATYHVWLIERTDGTVADVLFSTSATAPTMPANYTFKRRIGSIVRTAAAIKAFSQQGDEFIWKVPPFDFSAATLGTTATLYPLTVPTGIKVIARVMVYCTKPSASPSILVTSPDATDTDPTVAYVIFADFAGGFGMSELHVRTDTSGQIRARSTVATTTFQVQTFAYLDERGRTF